jgi:hypothetical protein
MRLQAEEMGRQCATVDRAAMAKADTPRTTAAAPKSDATPKGNFSVQLAAYDTRDEAEQSAKRLAARGIDARVDGEVKPFRVRTGYYTTRAQASAALQALAVEMAELLTTLPRLRAAPTAQLLRIRALSDGMGVLRDNLARRAAYVNQALKVVVPTPVKSTYGHSSSPFGGVVQQSGQFKVLAA